MVASNVLVLYEGEIKGDKVRKNSYRSIIVNDNAFFDTSCMLKHKKKLSVMKKFGALFPVNAAWQIASKSLPILGLL